MPDFLTLMSPEDGSKVAKKITAKGHVSVKLPYYYKGHEFQLEGFDGLVRLLEAAAKQGSTFVVRGKIRAGVNPQRMRRKHVEDPTLEEASHHWLLLDFDKHRPDVNPEEFCGNVRTFAEDARNRLPECFHNAATWYQATGSAGFKPGVRLRLGFWLDRPLSNLEIKGWLKGLPLDFSIYTPSQPCFIAHPILEGVGDPVPVRSGTLPGTSAVTLPESLKEAQDPSEDITKAVRKVKKAPEGERRNTLNKVAYSLAFKWSETDLSDARIYEPLSRAAADTALPSAEILVTLKAAIKDGRAKGDLNRKGWRQELALNDEGRVLPTAANVSLHLEHHETFVGRLAYNERTYSEIWIEPPPWGGDAPRNVSEADDTRIMEWFQSTIGIDAKSAWIRAGVHKAARLRSFDDVQDWLLSRPEWDGIERLDTFFIRHLGVDDTPLARAQSRCWFIQTARRPWATIEAPVRADYMLVLVGPQGIGKSTTFQTLCGPGPRYFLDSLPDLKDKDAVMLISKAWIVELAEMTQRKADRDTFKAFITRTVDQIRPPYGRQTIEVPRRSSLAGSTNEREFLVDPTGNRRVWPFECTRRVDLDLVLEERDQVWAEANYRAEIGEQAYLSPEMEALASEARLKFTAESGVEALLREALSNPPPHGIDIEPDYKYITFTQIGQLTGLDVTRASGQITDAMTALGWGRGKMDGKRVWIRPEGWIVKGSKDHGRKTVDGSRAN